MKPRRPNDDATGAVEHLPLTWDADDETRPCDRCPRDGGPVFWNGGREWCLCEDCYQTYMLGR